MSETGWGTLSEVRNGLGDPQVGSVRVRGPSLRSGTCQWTLPEVLDGLGTLREVRDGSEDRLGGPGCVWRSSTRSGTGRWTLL